MDDFLKDVGLYVADQFPAALAILLGTLVLLAWAGYKTIDSELSDGGKTVCMILIVGFALSIIGGIPKGYAEAKSSCRSIGPTIRIPSGLDPPFDYTTVPNIAYENAGCNTVWPQGRGL